MKNNIDEDIEKVRNFINHIRFKEPAQYSLQEWFLALESICEKAETLKIELITKEEQEKLKWERDYYKSRFEELNKQWDKVRIKLLGENYYNDGCDWKTCDEFMADDLIYKYKKRWWQFWRKV